MKKFMLICALFLLGMACSQDDSLTATVDPSPVVSQITKEKISLHDVAFQESTGYWLHKKGDPYTLANFRRVYNDILAGKYKELTRAEIGAVSETEELSATHYSVKFFPKTEAEQWMLERMEDINISYYPFEYRLLSEEQVEELDVTRSAVNTLPDETRYTVTYDDLRTVEGLVSPQTFKLPVIYAAWPVNKPFPANMDYEIVEELYIPDYSDESNVDSKVNTILETRSFFPPNIIINPGDTITRPLRTYRGRYMDYDAYLEQYVPIPGVKITFTSGSNFYNVYTDQNGYFSINAVTPLHADVIATFSNELWKITNNTTGTTPYQTHLGTVLNLWPALQDFSEILSYGALVCIKEMQRAVYYYYHGGHPIRTFSYDNGLLLRSLYEHNDYSGLFWSTGDGSHAYIEVFYNNRDDIAVIGTTLHELGHFTHYGEIGDFQKFHNTHDLLLEAYSSYMGSILTSEYYSIFGVDFAGNFMDTSQARQSWNKTSTSHYTPLYVDLFDSYNQYYSGALRPNENISTFSHSIIRQMAQSARTWEECRNIFKEYIDVFYTEYELNNYLDDYEYWFNVNN